MNQKYQIEADIFKDKRTVLDCTLLTINQYTSHSKRKNRTAIADPGEYRPVKISKIYFLQLRVWIPETGLVIYTAKGKDFLIVLQIFGVIFTK